MEDLVHRAFLHDTPEIHHHHVVRHLRDDAKVVRDEDDGGLVLVLQLAQQAPGSAPASSRRSRWSVRRRSAGAACTTAPWRSSRAGAARRTVARNRRRCGSPASRCRRRGTARPSSRAPAARETALSCSMIASTICSPTVCTGLNAAIGSCGISAISAPRRSRISRLRGERRARSIARGAAAIQDLAAGDAAGRIDQLQDGPHRHALAAAAFADDADDLAGEHVEAHAVDRAHRAFVQAERHAQVAHAQQRFSGCRDRRHRAGHRPPG